MKKFYSYDNMELFICGLDKKGNVKFPKKLQKKVIDISGLSISDSFDKRTSFPFEYGKIRYSDTSLGLYVYASRDVDDEFVNRHVRDLAIYFEEITGIQMPRPESIYVIAEHGNPKRTPEEIIKDDRFHSITHDEKVFAVSFRQGILFLDLNHFKNEDIIIDCFKNHWKWIEAKKFGEDKFNYMISFKDKDIANYQNVPNKHFITCMGELYYKISRNYAFNIKSGESLLLDIRRKEPERKNLEDLVVGDLGPCTSVEKL